MCLFLPEKAKEMFRKLVELARRLGRDPSFNEVRDDPDLPHPNDFAFYFGSYTEAQKEAHRVAFVYREEPEWMQTRIKTYIRIEEVDLMPRYTDAQLTASLQRLWDELGHFPNPSEVAKDPNCASVLTYEKRFGTDWNGVRTAMMHAKRLNDTGKVAVQKSDGVVSETVPVLSSDGEESFELPVDVLAATRDSSVSPELVSEPKPATMSEEATNALVSTGPEIMPPVETAEDDVTIISLLPRTIVTGINVSEYANVLRMHDSVQLFRTIGGVPVCKDYEGIRLLRNNEISNLPEPCAGVYYLVERTIALAVKLSGRSVEDLLIPKRFVKDGSTIQIQELTTL